MTIPGRNRALGELTTAELESLMAEDETLFCEHKAGIGGDGFQIARATASFANRLGGWILVGVKDCEPCEWETPEGAFVDTVRQKLEGQIDPTPPFAARYMTVGRAEIGVIRVYESADTPHITTRNGGIYIREPAEDKEQGKRVYKPMPIGSQELLLELARRGERARQRAEERLRPGSCPFIDEALQLRYDAVAGQLVPAPVEPAIVVRLAPLTVSPAFRDWAISTEALAACERAGRNLTDLGTVATSRQLVHAQGLAATCGRAQQGTHDDDIEFAKVAIDAAGIVGARLTLCEVKQGGTEITLGRLAELLVHPLSELAWLLEGPEFFGRACGVRKLRRVLKQADFQRDRLYAPHNESSLDATSRFSVVPCSRPSSRGCRCPLPGGQVGSAQPAASALDQEPSGPARIQS